MLIRLDIPPDEARCLTAAPVSQAKQRQDQVLDESMWAISLKPLLFRSLSSQDTHLPAFQVAAHSVTLKSHLLLFSLLSSSLEKVTFQQSLCEHSPPVFPGGSSFEGAGQAVGLGTAFPSLLPPDCRRPGPQLRGC